MRPFTCTAEDLARDVLRNEIPGGTYEVGITPGAPDGVTFRPYPFSIYRRYAVGGYAFEGSRVFPANIGVGLRGEGVVTRAIVACAQRGDVIGLWRDNRGRLWVDGVQIVEDREEAKDYARDRGEEAIWDAIAGECVYV